MTNSFRDDVFHRQYKICKKTENGKTILLLYNGWNYIRTNEIELRLSFSGIIQFMENSVYNINEKTLSFTGILTVVNGNTYIGEFKNASFNGQGTMTYANGNKYQGEWKDDMRHGKGTISSTNGNKYEGEWKDDMRHGKGTMTYANKNVYVGVWRNDRVIPSTLRPIMKNDKGTIYIDNREKKKKVIELPTILDVRDILPLLIRDKNSKRKVNLRRTKSKMYP